MEWEKKGRIYVVNNESDEKYSHGKGRAVIDMGTFLRAYPICYSKPGPDNNIISRSYYLDLDRNNPSKIINIGKKSVLDLGGIGEFDAHGIMVESVLKVGNELYAYYDGWSRRVDVPYDWAIGLAISHDNGISFKKYSKGPIIANSMSESYLFASPEVIKISDNNWHMWYLGGDNWNEYENNEGLYSTYTIKHAVSMNGIEWIRDGKQCIKSMTPDECQAGATTFKHKGLHHMVFSYRSAVRKNNKGNYALGYAWSKDLINWERNDKLLNIEKSASGWDSQMMCYPRVLIVDDKIYLFYSGNDNGREGFGYAELVKEN